MQGNAEFFAPLIWMRPSRGRPPMILNLSIPATAHAERMLAQSADGVTDEPRPRARRFMIGRKETDGWLAYVPIALLRLGASMISQAESSRSTRDTSSV